MIGIALAFGNLDDGRKRAVIFREKMRITAADGVVPRRCEVVIALGPLQPLIGFVAGFEIEVLPVRLDDELGNGSIVADIIGFDGLIPIEFGPKHDSARVAGVEDLNFGLTHGLLSNGRDLHGWMLATAVAESSAERTTKANALFEDVRAFRKNPKHRAWRCRLQRPGHPMAIRCALLWAALVAAPEAHRLVRNPRV
jgi:hypothetical protein